MGTTQGQRGRAAGRPLLCRAARGHLRGLCRLTGQQHKATPVPSGDKSQRPPWQHCLAMPLPSGRRSTSSTHAALKLCKSSSSHCTLTPNAIKLSKPAEIYGLVASPPQPRCRSSPHPGTSGTAFLLHFWGSSRGCTPASATLEEQGKRSSWCAQPGSRTPSYRGSSSAEQILHLRHVPMTPRSSGRHALPHCSIS